MGFGLCENTSGVYTCHQADNISVGGVVGVGGNSREKDIKGSAHYCRFGISLLILILKLLFFFESGELC